jgi:hypothetical protein
MLSENAERRRSVLDNLQKQLDEVVCFCNIVAFLSFWVSSFELLVISSQF